MTEAATAVITAVKMPELITVMIIFTITIKQNVRSKLLYLKS